MALTTGFVQKLKLDTTLGWMLVYIGMSPTSTDLLDIVIEAGDSSLTRSTKRDLMRMLQQAQLGGYQVTVTHGDTSSIITQVETNSLPISAIGEPIINDFFTVSGAGFAPDSQLVFQSSGGATTTVAPDLVRSHLLFVSSLPNSVPLGRNLLWVQSAAGNMGSVPVDVSIGPLPVRVLYSGAPKSSPYTIVFVANPAIEATAGGTFTADPVLQARATYQAGVRYCMQNFFAQAESLLQDLDNSLRIVSVFDTTAAANANNALVHQINPNIMETRRAVLNAFLNAYGERADVVIALHGDPVFTRSSAWFTTDDANGPTTAFTYDGSNHVYGHLQSTPGSAAIPANVNTGMTPLHEFSHAASDFDNGQIVDMYVDGAPGGFQVNKKFRNAATDPIPNNFATLDAANYTSDQNRDTLGYPNTWTSYHPTLIDAARPDIMDNYWLAANPLLCQHSRLSRDFLHARITVKVNR